MSQCLSSNVFNISRTVLYFLLIVYLSRLDLTVLVLVPSLGEKAAKIQTDTFRDELVNMEEH